VDPVDPERFDQMVEEAIASLPDHLKRAMDNVAVMVADRAPGNNLYGLYEGIPLTKRDAGYAMVVPDRITIYAGTITDHCRTEQEVVDRVRITVIHEIAHHFGIGDARLSELGWA
jgi:predicted Zn-dependent protease with MMP-like domain